jgi:DNA-directed RNA polymerase beta subunit
LREINKEEAMLSNFTNKKDKFYKSKKAYVDSLKAEAKDIKKGMDRLGGKKPDKRQEATDFLKERGLPQTEANIKHYLDNY